MKLPEYVYVVERIPPPNERKVYYSKTKVRTYRNRAGVAAFLSANKMSEFKVYRAKIEEWEDVGYNF